MKRMLILSILAMLLIAGFSEIGQAQEGFACPPDRACPELVFPSETMTGEVFWNEIPLGAFQNRAFFVVDPGPQTLVIRNIQDVAAPGFNQLFVYQEVSVRVNVRVGQTRTYNLRPRQQFIRGTLSLTCNVRELVAGENIVCQAFSDGAYLGDIVPGQRADFVIDPGQHTVTVQLVGDVAFRWLPPDAQTVNISAGRTARITARINKKDYGGRRGASVNCADFETAICDNYSTPRSCDEAVAMGIPARDAACCFPARDADKDGVACYGD
jgi:hypothetical protein